MLKRAGQCFCGAAYVCRSRNEWLFWLDNHHCPGAPESEEEPEEISVVHGDAQVERSYQWNGQYDGDYRVIPDINARQRIGFQVES